MHILDYVGNTVWFRCVIMGPMDVSVQFAVPYVVCPFISLLQPVPCCMAERDGTTGLSNFNFFWNTCVHVQLAHVRIDTGCGLLRDPVS